MTAADTGRDRYADLTDPALAATLQAEDSMDDAWNSGGNVGPPPSRDTCHPCAGWADHTHDATSGTRVELSDIELRAALEATEERAVLSDMAHDTDEGAWGLYGQLCQVAEQRQAHAAREVEADA